MPSLKDWNPRNAIRHWMKEKDCRIHDNLIKNDTATKQPWYKGVFDNTQEEEEEEEFDEDYLLKAKQNYINF